VFDLAELDQQLKVCVAHSAPRVVAPRVVNIIGADIVHEYLADHARFSQVEYFQFVFCHVGLPLEAIVSPTTLNTLYGLKTCPGPLQATHGPSYRLALP
jgi:hypothetical protein